jgi:anti-sigma factor RsiW
MAMTEHDEVDEIEALLPWFASGALDPQEASRVEIALARRPELRASLAAIEEDRAETIALSESLGAPSPHAWTRIMEAVEAEPRNPPITHRIAAWFEAVAAPQRGRFAWAAMAAAVVILLQAGAIIALLPKAGGSAGAYVSASADQSARPGVDILVSFAPDARLADVAALLKQHDAVIVDGPRPGGFYRLKVGGASGASETATLIQSFAQAPIVRMALPGGGK